MWVNNEEEIIRYQKLLNDGDLKKRLANLEFILKEEKAKLRPRKQKDYFINAHIHTTFSFSPHTPTMAIWMAYRSGLRLAGIMDHVTISGAREFIEAGRIAGVTTTNGIELKVDFSKTPLKNRHINQPYQKSIAHIAIFGIPTHQIDKVDSFLTPYREERNKRNLLMVKRLNKILEPFALSIDFTHDVLPISFHLQGGTVTERHILFALTQKIMARFSKRKEVIDFLKNELNVKISRHHLSYLENKNNNFYAYDIVHVFKTGLLEKFWINAITECPDVKDVLALADETGSISAYSYLGDVIDSPTGDHRDQKFEDDYLELLFDVIKELGFKAVTYTPTRNSMVQTKRINGFCEKYGLLQIIGEDNNYPRQPFICESLKNKQLHYLVDSTLALIGHDKRAEENQDEGFFSRRTIKKYPDLKERVSIFNKK